MKFNFKEWLKKAGYEIVGLLLIQLSMVVVGIIIWNLLTEIEQKAIDVLINSHGMILWFIFLPALFIWGSVLLYITGAMWLIKRLFKQKKSIFEN